MTDGAVNQSPGMNEREGLLADFICDVQDRLGPGCDELAIAQAILAQFDVSPRAPAPSAWQPIETEDRFQKGFNLALKQCAEAVKFCGECDCPRMTVDAIKALRLPSSDRGGVG
jgi:hypothetical protein